MTRTRAIAVALTVLGVTLGGAGLVVGMDGGATAQNDTASIVTDGDELTLTAASNSTLDGETNLAAGSTVTVRLTSTGGSPFLRTTNATVGEDGTFTATVDLASVEPETEFNVTVRHDGTDIGEATGTVVACEDCEQQATETDGSGTSVVTDGAVLRLSAGPGQTVTGQSDLAAGTVLTVRLRSASASAPFLRSAEATVTDSGTFEATFDLREAQPNTSFEAVVQHDGDRLHETNGVVVDCVGDCEPTPTPAESDEGWESSASAVDTDSVAISAIARGVSGGTVPINVSVGQRDAVAVSIGGNDVNYVLNATVRDGDDDGVVRLQFDTSAAGHDAATVTAASAADSVEVLDETDLPARNGALDPAGYAMQVFVGEDPGGAPVDNGRLILLAGDDASASGDGEAADTGGTGDEFGLSQSLVRTQSGQQATLRVSVAESDAATVAIGGSESGFRLNATLRDSNGDGEVVALFDATAVGDDGRAALLPSDSADEVRVTDEESASTPLPAGPYDIDIYRGTSVDGSPADVGTLVVGESGATESTPANGSTAESQSALLGGGALLAGGLLAVVGLGFVLGVFRD
ncbi:BGTF surface domain-containing protein [Halorientalis litorea]|uniref:BGTF surface domain-containing protein n=1 Tax=Halorientalis litorea TaxID=2931977 RepID=UPI001FF4B2E1|nr:BGTF surface domain-containing protein [Halorientalis litorea]